MRLGVAISTTGEPHRVELLRQAVAHWHDALPQGAALYVTVDGGRAAFERAVHAVGDWTASVVQAGRGRPERDGKQGVAVNKNTGLELLVDKARSNQMFLSDDDTWPRSSASLVLHTGLGLPHSMVCWGRHRYPQVSRNRDFVSWSWPRGVVLYVEDMVIDTVGGMDENFGPGGHEHVEWSNRIHNAGFTPVPFPTPVSYVNRGGTGAIDHWHAEDMARRGEPLGNLRLRRRHLTSVKRIDGDWERIEKIMAAREGSSDYVPFRATPNGRASATMSSHSA